MTQLLQAQWPAIEKKKLDKTNEKENFIRLSLLKRKEHSMSEMEFEA